MDECKPLYVGLQEWAKFYHKDYTFVGRLGGGLYYDGTGAPTRAKADFDRHAQQARSDAAAQTARDAVFPACASRWSQAEAYTRPLFVST